MKATINSIAIATIPPRIHAKGIPPVPPGVAGVIGAVVCSGVPAWVVAGTCSVTLLVGTAVGVVVVTAGDVVAVG